MEVECIYCRRVVDARDSMPAPVDVPEDASICYEADCRRQARMQVARNKGKDPYEAQRKHKKRREEARKRKLASQTSSGPPVVFLSVVLGVFVPGLLILISYM